MGAVAEVETIRLTELTSCGGCAAKWGASVLADLVGPLAEGARRAGADPALLVGLAPSDDAAVYRLGPDLALVSTTDFFPPLVDDPDDFGAIAAANACSDVFAMGGRVILALNVAAFPESLPAGVIARILGSAAEVVEAAGGTVAGGHTIRSDEPVFGLAVQGVVHPDRVLTKASARVGQVVVLSKPLGTGLVLAAAPDPPPSAIAGMRRLNRAAAEVLAACGAAVGAVTDVTGFGLVGHALEVADRSGVAIHLDAASLPAYPGSIEAARAGTRTGGDARNREAVAGRVAVGVDVEVALDVLAHDPQTSGGLLATVDDVPGVLDELGSVGFVAIGEVVGEAPGLRLG